MQKQAPHTACSIAVLQAVVIYRLHSGRSIARTKICGQCVCRIVVAHCDHGIEVGIDGVLTILRNKPVIIFIDSPHDVQLDQAGCLHPVVVDTSLCPGFEIAYIYCPVTVGRWK